MPVTKKRPLQKRASSKKIQPSSPWKGINQLHERFPATSLALIAAMVAVPIGLISARTQASGGDRHAALLPLLVAPPSNAITSHVVTLRGKLTSGDPRRVAFVIDGNPNRTVSASPTDDGGWQANWDTSNVANGDHTVSLRAENDEASAMTGSVHVNVQNTHPPLHVTLDQPAPYEVEKTDTLAMHATVAEGAKNVTFIISQLFVGKEGHREVVPVQRYVASAQDTAMQNWSATTDPAGIVPHANGLFQVQAQAEMDGYAQTLSSGVPMILTSTSSKVSFAGVPQENPEINFIDIDVSSPEQGASVSGMVPIVSAGTPIDAVVAMKVSVWDGKGYSHDLPAQDVKGEWTAMWDTTGLSNGWYWIRSQAYGPAFVPSLSEPILVHLQN